MDLPRSPLLAGACALAAAMPLPAPAQAPAAPPANASPAAATIMAPPVAPLGAQAGARLLARLAALDAGGTALAVAAIRNGGNGGNGGNPAPRAAAGATPYGFAIAAHHPGARGQAITRVQHTYKGLAVFGSEAVVVTDSAGAIVSTTATDRRPGIARPAPGLAAAEVPAQLTPALSPQQAIAAAVAAAVAAAAPPANGVAIHRWPPVAELLLYPVLGSVRTAAAKPAAALNALDEEEVVERYALAYLVKTRMVRDGRPLYHDTIVDARSGAIVARWQALQTQAPGVIGSGSSQYNGVVPVSTTLDGQRYRMLTPSRGTGGKFGGMAITNANHSPMYNPDPGDVYANDSNSWGDGKQYDGSSTTGTNGQTAAVNALWGLMNTYDANRNVLGWHSLDGNNTATHIAVHIDRDYDNAFYDDRCKCMFIGDGGRYFTNLGSIDVIGHEMSHGVTAATANLVYSGESGGLNESHSDIGGEMVEAYARAGGAGSVIPATGNDWMVGKEISRTGEPLRFMVKPSRDGRSPDAWSTELKRLDVHYSSGPNNRMFYFLSQGSSADPSSDSYSKYLVRSPQAMTGIGNDKAYRIWFKALTTRFTSSTNYASARARVLETAQELYGVGSKEAVAVQRAYAAINVGDDVDEGAGKVQAQVNKR